MINVDILCTDSRHPVVSYLGGIRVENAKVLIAHDISSLKGGDFLFLVSCTEIVKPEICSLYDHALVLHASDLPAGRGWSPHVWAILNGATEITVTLLEADSPVDSGRVWRKEAVQIPSTALYDQINDVLFKSEIRLIEYAIKYRDEVKPNEQGGEAMAAQRYNRKRTPEDSRIDPKQTIEDQFNLLRVCDPIRYPAFFEIDQQKYTISIARYDEQ